MPSFITSFSYIPLVIWNLRVPARSTDPIFSKPFLKQSYIHSNLPATWAGLFRRHFKRGAYSGPCSAALWLNLKVTLSCKKNSEKGTWSTPCITDWALFCRFGSCIWLLIFSLTGHCCSTSPECLARQFPNIAQPILAALVGEKILGMSVFLSSVAMLSRHTQRDFYTFKYYHPCNSTWRGSGCRRSCSVSA